MDDFDQPPLPWWKRRRWWVVLGVAVVLLASVVPGYRAVKEWRAEGLARQALALAEDESTYYEAWEKANSAYYLAPGNAEVVRSLAMVYSKADPGQALPHWERALELSGGDPQDRLGLARAALELGLLDRVGEELENLEKAGVESEDKARLQAGYLARLREHKAAMEVLGPWVRRPGAEEATHSLYLQVSVASADPDLMRRGLEHIRAMALDDGLLGLKALQLLLPLRDKDDDMVALLDRRLGEHPKAGREDRLRWYSWKWRAGIMERPAAYAEALREFDLKRDEDKVELGRWLNQNGFSDRVTALVPEVAARRRQDLFLVYLDALAIQGRWTEVRRILESGTVPLESYLQQVFLARSYYETGLDRRARLGWQRVRLEIANDPEKLAYFATYARRLNLHEEAREAYERMARLPASQRAGHVERIRMERQLGDTEKLWEALRAMHAAYPDDVAVENDMLYTQFLLGRGDTTDLERAARLVEKNPNYLAHRITLALGHLKREEPEQAMAVFDGLEIPLPQLSATFRTVLGAVLRTNGQDPQADASFRGVDVRNLMREEQQLFEAYAR